MTHYLDDLEPGQRFAAPTITVSREEILAFAGKFDPQPFHLDDVAANASFFGGLCASGWHTTAITMRLLVDSEFKPAGGIIGFGADGLKWLKPVRPGDRLTLAIEVIDARPSRSNAARGVGRFKVDTINQHGEVVQTMTANLTLPRRP